MASCVFTWKGTSDIHHALDHSHVTREAGRWRRWLRGGAGRAGMAPHPQLHEAEGQAGARNLGEGPRQSKLAPLDVSTVCPVHM